MGQEVKRVPADFDWPLKKVWRGYINPHPFAADCPDCRTGYSPQAKLFSGQWRGSVPIREAAFDPVAYGVEPLSPDSPALRRRVIADLTRWGGTPDEAAIRREIDRVLPSLRRMWMHHLNEADVSALIEGDELREFTHRPRPGVTLETYIREYAYKLWEEDGRPDGRSDEFWFAAEKAHSNHYLPQSNGYRPTAQEVNEWSVGSVGSIEAYCGLSAYRCVVARCRREGAPYHCETCDGDGYVWASDEARELYESWTEEEPPTGEAYQIWETFSEGSPISPPFVDPSDLANWMHVEDPEIGVETWRKFIVAVGYAPALAIVDGCFVPGIEVAVGGVG